MRNILQLEGKVSRSRSKHEGESSADICDRPGRTRVRSLRQLPTDHDYAVPTREYQLDQSSLILLRLLLTLSSITKSRSPHLDRSLHINVRIADRPSKSRKRHLDERIDPANNSDCLAAAHCVAAVATCLALATRASKRGSPCSDFRSSSAAIASAWLYPRPIAWPR
jgi:hypothetical protein